MKMAPNVLSVSDANSHADEENVIAILALTALLVVFFAYCCWGTSRCRSLSSRINTCRHGEPEPTESRRPDVDQTSGNPTIILLPHGRILVVDGTVFARFQSENSGLDLFELGDRMFRDEQNHRPRSPSFVEVDSETRIKDLPTGTSLPPTYESLFGSSHTSTPPPYTEALRNDSGRTTAEDDVESVV